MHRLYFKYKNEANTCNYNEANETSIIPFSINSTLIASLISIIFNYKTIYNPHQETIKST